MSLLPGTTKIDNKCLDIDSLDCDGSETTSLMSLCEPYSRMIADEVECHRELHLPSVIYRQLLETPPNKR